MSKAKKSPSLLFAEPEKPSVNIILDKPKEKEVPPIPVTIPLKIKQDWKDQAPLSEEVRKKLFPNNPPPTLRDLKQRK